MDQIIKHQLREIISAKGYTRDTVRLRIEGVQQFIKWCNSESISAENASVQDIYDFVSEQRRKYLKQSTIRGKLKALEYYFKVVGRMDNPIYTVTIEKADRRLPYHMLDESELEAVFNRAKAGSLIQKRARCMLSLIIYQGVRRQELALMLPDHINFDNMRVFVPPTKTSNARYLPIDIKQVTCLQDYIYNLRDKLLLETGKKTGKLFFTTGKGHKVAYAAQLLLNRLKKEQPHVKTLFQLRQSRITIWANTLNLREAQYKAGHRYVTSTQRYFRKDVEQLRDKLRSVHPMEAF